MSKAVCSTRAKNPCLFRRLLRAQFLIGGILWLLVSLFSLKVLLPGGLFDMELINLSWASAFVADSKLSNTEKLRHDMEETARFFIEGVMEHARHAPGYSLAYQVYDAQGRLLVASGGMPVGLPAKAPEGSMAMDPSMDPGCKRECQESNKGISGWLHDLRGADGRQWRVSVLRDPKRGLSIQVGELREMRWRRTLDMILLHSASLAVLYVMLIAMSFGVMRKVLKPVTELARDISARTPGSLEPVRPPVVFEETAPLVDELNVLLDGARQHLQEERGFLADAAHELRTPLAAVGMQAHALVLARTEQGRESALEELNAGLKRVSHLAQQLLTSARVDARGEHAGFRREDFAELARERAAGLSPLAMKKAIELELHAPESLPAVIDRFGFGSVLDNLIDNAIRYTPEGGCVDIHLAREAQGIRLEVSDTGPGIPDTEREKVLQRFYRVPGNLVPGSGLGLSIVRRVVELHGGRLELASGAEGRGLSVRIFLEGEGLPAALLARVKGREA